MDMQPRVFEQPVAGPLYNLKMQSQGNVVVTLYRLLAQNHTDIVYPAHGDIEGIKRQFRIKGIGKPFQIRFVFHNSTHTSLYPIHLMLSLGTFWRSAHETEKIV